MITSPLTGNLGNHMFSYAVTRCVAKENGYDYGFNSHPEYDYHNGKPQMDFMDIDYGMKHNGTYNSPPFFVKNIWKEYYETQHYKNGDTVDFHPYQPEVFQLEDNTQLYIRCCQNASYFNKYKEDIREWFKIKPENESIYKSKIREFGIDIEDNRTTVLNIRGGEYKGIQSLILRKEYWRDAMNIMKERDSSMRFLCVTDDEPYANQILDFKVPVTHLSIGGDYYIINNARNLILSNSSFAIFPTWLNQYDPYVIAPRYWARHNVSTGYWASSNVWTFGWKFLDRDGKLYAN